MFHTTKASTEEGNGNIHTSTTNSSTSTSTTTAGNTGTSTTTCTIEQNLLDQVRYLYGLYYSVYIYICVLRYTLIYCIFIVCLY